MLVNEGAPSEVDITNRRLRNCSAVAAGHSEATRSFGIDGLSKAAQGQRPGRGGPAMGKVPSESLGVKALEESCGSAGAVRADGKAGDGTPRAEVGAVMAERPRDSGAPRPRDSGCCGEAQSGQGRSRRLRIGRRA